MSIFGEQLKKTRKEKGFTQEALGNGIGYSKQAISAYERGENEPDYQTLCKIADALSCTTDYLLGREKAPTHEAASIADQTGLPASMIADLQREKRYIDFLEAREKAGLPTDYPFEFKPGDPDYREKAREIATPCAHGQDARRSIEVLYALWEHSDITELGWRFFEWEKAIVELSKKNSKELLDNADLKRYRIMRFIEQFLHEYEYDKTGRDEYEEDW